MHKGVACYGEDLRNVTDVNGFTPVTSCVSIVYPAKVQFLFSRPRWFDLLMGTDSVRKAILQGKSEKEIMRQLAKRVADLPGHEAEVFTLLRNGSATSPHSVRNLRLSFLNPTGFSEYFRYILRIVNDLNTGSILHDPDVIIQ